jgi:uncharacterized membrane protein required for colicin V production
MGLDLVLGGLVLIAAIRGWLKGFMVQAIRLTGLVAAVYVAVPVRDQVKPYVIDYLPTIRPELVDRLLWWASAVASYLVIVGVASLAVAVSRRQTFGMPERSRADQFAGMGLGVMKGLIAAAFLVAAVQKYAQPQIEKVTWALEQTKESVCWDWNEKYHPAARIWSAPPVQKFVEHIQQMGLWSPSGKTGPEPEPEKPVQTASRTPELNLPTAYRVPAPPQRRKLVLRKPFEVKSRGPKASPRGVQRGSNREDTVPEVGDPTRGLDPEFLKAVELLKGQLSGSAGFPALDDN